MNKMKLYVPGFFSLLLLLPLMMFQLSRWHVFDKQYVLEVAYHTPEQAKVYNMEFPPRRQYTLIELTGSAQEDDVKLAFAKTLVKEMMAKYDMIKGVHIHFADTAKYDSFIKVLDFCSQQETLNYLTYGSDFWIFNRFESEEQRDFSMSLSHCTVLIPFLPQPKRSYEYSFTYAQVADQRLWPIALLFILLVVFGLFKRCRPVIT